MRTNYFIELNAIDVSDKIEKKNGLSYVSWAYAWAELKKRYPDSIYTIYENEQGWNYHTDGRTAWVKTGITVEQIEHIEYLPVMDYRNKSIPLENITSFDINKTIQRSLTKAVARHGIGLYVFAGEDLPESIEETCQLCSSIIDGYVGKNGKKYTSKEQIELSKKEFGKKLCLDCCKKMKMAKKAMETENK